MPAHLLFRVAGPVEMVSWKGVSAVKKPVAYSDALTRFVEYLAVEQSFSVDTVRRYRTWARRWFVFLGQRGVPWLSASRDDAIAWKAYLVESGHWRGDAVRQALTCGRKLYDWAIDREWYTGRNPFAGMRAPKTYRTVKLAPTPEQIAAVLDQDWPADFRGLRARAIWALFYGTGLRRSELRMLDMADVDLEQRLVAVNHGKAGSNDVMPLVPYVAYCLEAYLRHARPLICSRSDGPVFVGLRGKRISVWAIREDVRWASSMLSRRITPHDLRRAAATHLLQNGADVRQVQLFLRHKRLDTTMWYLGESEQNVRDAVQRLHPLASKPLPGASEQTPSGNGTPLAADSSQLVQVIQPLVANTLRELLSKLTV